MLPSFDMPRFLCARQRTFETLESLTAHIEEHLDVVLGVLDGRVGVDARRTLDVAERCELRGDLRVDVEVVLAWRSYPRFYR